MPKMIIGNREVTPVVNIASRIDDSDLVHKTQDETIEGNKTFQSRDLYQKSPTIIFGDTSTNGFIHLAFRDKNNRELSHLKTIYNNDGSLEIGMAASRDNASTFSTIKVKIDSEGVTTTSAPTPTDTTSTSSTQIATVGWVNNASLSTNVVHRTGTETIGGSKTFTSAPIILHTSPSEIIIKSSDKASYETPESNYQIGRLSIKDKNDKICGYWFCEKRNDGDIRNCLETRRYDSEGNYKYTSLQVYCDSDGLGYCNITSNEGSNISLSKVTNSTTDTIVPTMGWVNNPSTSTNVVHRSGNETISGAKVFSDVITFNGGSTTTEGGKIIFAPVNKNSSYKEGVIDVYGSTPSDETTHCIRLRFRDSEGIHVYKDGHASVETPPSESNSTSLKNIPTAGWVNDPTKSTNVVHRTGDETITGIKIFNNAPKFRNNLTNSLSVTATEEQTLVATSTNSDGLADGMSIIRKTTYNASGNNARWVSYRAGFRKADNSGNKWPSIDVGVDENENNFVNLSVAYATSPTPATTDNSTKIATTAYVNNKIQFVNSLPANPVSGVLYLIPE